MAFANAQRSSTQYQTPRWRVVRAEQLRREPTCRSCRNEQRIVRATHVDHIKPPHTSDPAAFWAASTHDNLQSLCKHHSDVKTGREVAARMSRKRPPEQHPGVRG